MLNNKTKTDMKNTISTLTKKMLLSIYGVNALINLKVGLNIDGSKIIEEINYNK